MIRHRNDGWYAVSDTGETLDGPFPTREEAVKRLKEIKERMKKDTNYWKKNR